MKPALSSKPFEALFWKWAPWRSELTKVIRRNLMEVDIKLEMVRRLADLATSSLKRKKGVGDQKTIARRIAAYIGTTRVGGSGGFT